MYIYSFLLFSAATRRQFADATDMQITEYLRVYLKARPLKKKKAAAMQRIVEKIAMKNCFCL